MKMLSELSQGQPSSGQPTRGPITALPLPFGTLAGSGNPNWNSRKHLNSILSSNCTLLTMDFASGSGAKWVTRIVSSLEKISDLRQQTKRKSKARHRVLALRRPFDDGISNQRHTSSFSHQSAPDIFDFDLKHFSADREHTGPNRRAYLCG
jgi:hypothetical protein